MRFIAAIFSICLLSGAALQSQNLQITPNTTLTAETSNNTSASDTFAAQTNGNVGANNISKVPISALLYPGATTNIYAHLMPWFGPSNHMDVGYASNDRTQVRRQVDDMMSRGIRGAIVDWYGPADVHHDQSTQYLRDEAETRGGQFEFSVQEDHGSQVLKSCAQTAGCDMTAQLLSDLNYAASQYFPSSAYMRINGRPVLSFFDVEQYNIDWTRVRAALPSNPVLIFRNSGGFTKAQSDGSFAWVTIDTTPITGPNNWNQAYLDKFYTTALTFPNMHTIGGIYKGFDDDLAAWGKHRIMNQNCGQTWLNTFDNIASHYSASNQLENLHLVTWNDYEEGSELESGIDNCIGVIGAMADNLLVWSVPGDLRTVHHYTVFISKDGQNLMSLGDQPSGTYSLDLSRLNLASGGYTFYVKATGQPSMTNKMSQPVNYVAGALALTGPSIELGATPASLSLAAGQSGTVSLSVTPQSGFTGSVTFACSNLPAMTRCSFAPDSVKTTGSAATTSLTITTAAASAGLRAPNVEAAPQLANWFSFGSPALGLVGMILVGRKRSRKRVAAKLGLLALLAVILLQAACGGAAGKAASPPTQSTPTTATASPSTPAGHFEVIVTATAGSVVRHTVIGLTMQ